MNGLAENKNWWNCFFPPHLKGGSGVFGGVNQEY